MSNRRGRSSERDGGSRRRRDEDFGYHRRSGRDDDYRTCDRSRRSQRDVRNERERQRESGSSVDRHSGRYPKDRRSSSYRDRERGNSRRRRDSKDRRSVDLKKAEFKRDGKSESRRPPKPRDSLHEESRGKMQRQYRTQNLTPPEKRERSDGELSSSGEEQLERNGHHLKSIPKVKVVVPSTEPSLDDNKSPPAKRFKRSKVEDCRDSKSKKASGSLDKKKTRSSKREEERHKENKPKDETPKEARRRERDEERSNRVNFWLSKPDTGFEASLEMTSSRASRLVI